MSQKSRSSLANESIKPSKKPVTKAETPSNTLKKKCKQLWTLMQAASRQAIVIAKIS
jgi:hypothetical protein